ncbi:putative transmembrane protein [Lysobacter dokdonensis DS-58]|uniref:Putative transmembrane protein n=1 Tax=Lysobacter dokdonensis DS-58 TaxID=1300345 RepID=A0A0A2WHV5_9GAMM|nr:restriction endonuclease [Lysobacter dokdonensis]KGQ19398.1 putative transmembrane protein [Lysobacter dokdonensis DS-58]
MPSATSIVVAIVVIALIGALGTIYFWTIRRRQDEALNGVRALSAMRWREFSHFVIDAMRHRGYDVLTPDDEADRGQQTEFLLTRNGERALLGCKHGSAYKLSKQSVSEFVAAMKFQAARSGLLVTPGSVDPDARKAAEEARVELIDGGALWPEVAPLLPQSLAEDVRKDASKRARMFVWISWAAALVIGVAVGSTFGGNEVPLPQVASPMRATPAAAAPELAKADAAAPTAPQQPASAAAMPMTSEEEDLQRAEVVRRVSSLPGVYRANWSTKSTLQVQVDETSTERFDAVCTVLTRYATLRTARVYLEPPEHSEQAPRFKQCATL